MKAAGSIVRDSGIVRFFTALITALLITSATFLPFLIEGAVATPLALQQSNPPASNHSLVNRLYPQPEQCLGNCSAIHDPNVWYEDGVYWRFSTSGNIAIATAPSLEGPWKYKGALLSNGTSIFVNGTQDVWAPSIHKREDLYYCHYAVSSLGLQNSTIGVATSPSLSPGTWTDHGSSELPLSDMYNLIDPSIYQETSDSPIYFSFGSYWNGIYQIELLPWDDTLKFGAWAAQNSRINNIIRNGTENAVVVEGATMHKNGNYYYMFFSVGWCCNTLERGLAAPGDVYHVVVCRAEGPSGPFYDAKGKNCLTESGGTTILATHDDVYAPGGQGVMVHPENGRTVMYYHYVKPSVGYQPEQFFFGYNYVDWKSGWPTLVAA